MVDDFMEAQRDSPRIWGCNLIRNYGHVCDMVEL